MKKFILVCLACLVPSLALAAQNPASHAYHKLNRTLLNAVALNAAAATRTFEVTEQEMAGYSVLALFVKFARSAATDVQMSCTASDDAGTTDYTLHSCAVAAGVCTSSAASWKYTTSSTGNWVWRVDTMGLPRVTCTFSGTSGGANDLVTVTGYAIAQ